MGIKNENKIPPACLDEVQRESDELIGDAATGLLHGLETKDRRVIFASVRDLHLLIDQHYTLSVDLRAKLVRSLYNTAVQSWSESGGLPPRVRAQCAALASRLLKDRCDRLAAILDVLPHEPLFRSLLQHIRVMGGELMMSDHEALVLEAGVHTASADEEGVDETMAVGAGADETTQGAKFDQRESTNPDAHRLELVELGSNLFRLARRARHFFDPTDAWAFLEDEAWAKCHPHDQRFFHYTELLVRMLPTRPEAGTPLSSKPLWLDRIMELWSFVDNHARWDEMFVKLLSRTAKQRSSCLAALFTEPATPSIVERALSAFLCSLKLALAGAKRGGAGAASGSQRRLPRLSMGSSDTPPCLPEVTAKLLVYTLTPAVINWVRELLDLCGDYLHPSNSGPWTPKLARFLAALAHHLCVRLARESGDSADRSRGDRLHLEAAAGATPCDSQLVTELLRLVEPFVWRIMLNKSRAVSDVGARMLCRMATLRPGICLPQLLGRALDALESSAAAQSSHLIIAWIRGMSRCAHPLWVSRSTVEAPSSFWAIPIDVEAGGYAAFLPQLLSASLGCIEFNDPEKSKATLTFYTSVLLSIPLVHSAGSDDVLYDVRLRIADSDWACTSFQNCLKFLTLAPAAPHDAPASSSLLVERWAPGAASALQVMKRNGEKRGAFSSLLSQPGASAGHGGGGRSTEHHRVIRSNVMIMVTFFRALFAQFAGDSSSNVTLEDERQDSSSLVGQALNFALSRPKCEDAAVYCAALMEVVASHRDRALLTFLLRRLATVLDARRDGDDDGSNGDDDDDDEISWLMLLLAGATRRSGPTLAELRVDLVALLPKLVPVGRKSTRWLKQRSIALEELLDAILGALVERYPLNDGLLLSWTSSREFGPLNWHSPADLEIETAGAIVDAIHAQLYWTDRSAPDALICAQLRVLRACMLGGSTAAPGDPLDASGLSPPPAVLVDGHSLAHKRLTERCLTTTASMLRDAVQCIEEGGQAAGYSRSPSSILACDVLHNVLFGRGQSEHVRAALSTNFSVWMHKIVWALRGPGGVRHLAPLAVVRDKAHRSWAARLEANSVAMEHRVPPASAAADVRALFDHFLGQALGHPLAGVRAAAQRAVVVGVLNQPKIWAAKEALVLSFLTEPGPGGEVDGPRLKGALFTLRALVERSTASAPMGAMAGNFGSVARVLRVLFFETARRQYRPSIVIQIHGLLGRLIGCIGRDRPELFGWRLAQASPGEEARRVAANDAWIGLLDHLCAFVRDDANHWRWRTQAIGVLTVLPWPSYSHPLSGNMIDALLDCVVDSHMAVRAASRASFSAFCATMGSSGFVRAGDGQWRQFVAGTAPRGGEKEQEKPAKRRKLAPSFAKGLCDRIAERLASNEFASTMTRLLSHDHVFVESGKRQAPSMLLASATASYPATAPIKGEGFSVANAVFLQRLVRVSACASPEHGERALGALGDVLRTLVEGDRGDRGAQAVAAELWAALTRNSLEMGVPALDPFKLSECLAEAMSVVELPTAVTWFENAIRFVAADMAPAVLTPLLCQAPFPQPGASRGGVKSSVVARQLCFLRAALRELHWRWDDRFGAISNVIELAGGFLLHGDAQVRLAAASLLAQRWMGTYGDPNASNFNALLSDSVRQVMAVALSDVDDKTSDIEQRKRVSRARESLMTCFSALSSSSSGPGLGLFCSVFVQHLAPFVLAILGDSDRELMTLAKAFVGRLAVVGTLPMRALDALMGAMQSLFTAGGGANKAARWQVREAILPVLQILVFQHRFIRPKAVRIGAVKVCQLALFDPRIEVRRAAANAWGSIIKGAREPFLLRQVTFYSAIAANDYQGDPVKQHGAILALGAILNMAPYALPAWAVAALDALLRSARPGSVDVQRIAAEWFRTHHDEWAEFSTLLSNEQKTGLKTIKGQNYFV